MLALLGNGLGFGVPVTTALNVTTEVAPANIEPIFTPVVIFPPFAAPFTVTEPATNVTPVVNVSVTTGVNMGLVLYLFLLGKS